MTSGEFSPVFRREILNAGFQISGDPNDLFGADAKPKEFSVGGIVSALNAKLCSGLTTTSDGDYAPDGEVNGALSMSMEWQIYSELERRVVAKVTTLGTAREARGSINGMQDLANNAFADNVRALINSEAFRTAFIGASRPAGQKVEANTQGPVTITAGKSSSTISDAVGSVVGVFDGSGFGSGVLVGEEGYIVTNCHVVGAATAVKIRWSDGFQTNGEVLRNDRRRDVALIKTTPHGRTPLKLSLTSPQVGSAVYAIGMPLDEKYQGTVTKGIVSANRIFDGFSYIQADVAINHGNSGGPLLDEQGNVIGLTVAGLETAGVPVGLNLFIPARDVVDFLSLELH